MREQPAIQVVAKEIRRQRGGVATYLIALPGGSQLRYELDGSAGRRPEPIVGYRPFV
ncbi:MAG: hypothetical protein ACRET5_09045 [Steroidobacteraceae bacterium]